MLTEYRGKLLMKIRSCFVNLREKFEPGPAIFLFGGVGRAPARRLGDPGSNPGPGGNMFVKLTTHDLPDG